MLVQYGEIDSSPGQDFQCVDGEVVFIEYPTWASYPVVINHAGDPSVCHKISNDPNHSYKQSCTWSTSNPVKSFSFPDYLKPFLPPSTSKYVIYEVYEYSDCTGEALDTEGGILDNCVWDEESSMYTKRHFDGTIAY
jgi:hypothetical protein